MTSTSGLISELIQALAALGGIGGLLAAIVLVWKMQDDRRVERQRREDDKERRDQRADDKEVLVAIINRQDKQLEVMITALTDNTQSMTMLGELIRQRGQQHG